MIKLAIIGAACLTLLTFVAQRAIPADVYFKPDTTLDQAVAALGDVRPIDDLYYAGPGRALVFVRDRSAMARAESFWKTDTGFLQRTGQKQDARILGCWERHDCPPVIVTKVTVQNVAREDYTRLGNHSAVDHIVQPTLTDITQGLIDFFD